MNIWIISPGKNASIWEDCKNNNYIAIGWDSINMNNIQTKFELDEKLKHYQDEKGKDANVSLRYFSKEIKIDDIVIARQGLSTIVGIGKVTSEYISPEDLNNPRKDLDFKQVRQVKWFSFKKYTLKSGQFTRAYTIVQTDENDLKFKTHLKRVILNENIKQQINLLKDQNQIILQGPPGTGKTRLAKQMVNFIINGNIEPNIDNMKDQVKLIQFHPSYSYEDFVRGIVAKPNKNGNGIMYESENKVLAKMAKDAKNELGDEYYNIETSDKRKKEILKESKKYILIIDEINRANLSSVLGELIYALEYRDESVESMYELEENGTKSREITLPSNLYIIGTMNTADRSIGHIDYAIRRRFAFETILPNENEIDLQEGKDLFKKVEKLFSDNNLSPEFEKDRVMLGHSYFIAKDSEELEKKLKYQILPLLKEYVSDGVLTDNATAKIDML